MKKLLLLYISLFLVTSICHSQPQIKVTEIGSVRLYKPYETIYKNLYCMRADPYRINDTVMFSKLLFGGVQFEAIYQFKNDKLIEILLRKDFNGEEFTHIAEVMKTNYGRQTEKNLTENGFEVFWNLDNIDITLNVNMSKNRYTIFFVTKNNLLCINKKN